MVVCYLQVCCVVLGYVGIPTYHIHIREKAKLMVEPGWDRT